MRLTLRQTFVAVALLLGGCGHTIPGSLTGDGKPYDFAKQHPCTDPQPQGDQIQVRYLGSGGIYLRWRDEAILIGPSFSNPGLIRARFLWVKPDKTRIESALNGFELQRVAAILAGHSHYDHLADVPEIARRLPAVPIWVNENGKHALAGEGLGDRVRQLAVSDELTDLTPSIRFRAVESGHAPQLCRWRHFPCVYGKGPIRMDWTTPLPRHRLASMLGGETYAFVIELHDGDVVRYRIYYNDASPDSPLGQTTGDFDLAILCMAQWKWVRDYPRDLLAVLRPRHVLVSHWDNFFTEARQTTRFVPNLSNAGVAGFLAIVNEKVSGNAGPVSDVCGVKTPRWTMAAPASSMLFEPRPLRAEGMP
jgi:L-ascorbate metabolism protein UlaG (beta-lactamase superfamily)